LTDCRQEDAASKTAPHTLARSVRTPAVRVNGNLSK
jgi:hypothetical protein